MLRENTLFGETDKVKQAIARIQLHEPKEGYYVAFSGGKDSCVILDLVKRSECKFDAHFNVTSVDPPELTKFVNLNYSEVIMERPKMSMRKLIEKKGMLPTRIARYCCAEYKEKGGVNRVVITGIRHAESRNRSKRKMYEPCRIHAGKQYLHPIIDWSTNEVWEYIHSNAIPYCCLYDEGFKRIGCVCCPFASKKQKLYEKERWPNIYKYMWRGGAELSMKKREAEGNRQEFKTVDDMMNWWIYNPPKNYNEINIFGVMADESIT